MDWQPAAKKIEHYMNLICDIRLEKNHQLSHEMKIIKPYISARLLPDLLKKGTGPITVRDFLEKTTEEEAYVVLSQLRKKLVQFADFFSLDLLIEAYLRLRNLRDVVEGLGPDDC